MWKQVLFTLALVVGLVAVANAQFTIPHIFSPNTRAQSSQVNANFDLLKDALDRRGGTMTGTLTTQLVQPDGNNTRNLGASGTRYATIYGNALNVGSGGITANGVGLVGADGRIPAISTTYFANTDVLLAVATKTGVYTTVTTDRVILANGTFTINLYAVSGNSGRTLEIKNIGTGVVTIDGNLSETIDGAATYTLDGQYFSVTLFCTGTEWVIL